MNAYREEYEKKKIDVDRALSLVKSGDMIWTSYNGLEPAAFMSKLHTIAPRVENVVLRHAGVYRPYPFVMDPACKGHIIPCTGFSDEFTRAVHDTQNTWFIPTHLHNGFERAGLEETGIDIFVCMVSPMDDRGYFRMSLSVIAEQEASELAKMIILEVNPNLPQTNGDVEIHISDVDYLYESEEPIVAFDEAEPGEIDMQIGKYVADLVPDGATIQLGIGNIPNAAAQYFMEKNDLGVHTEMITSSMAKLATAGVINGRKKTLHKGKIIGNFALGSQELYSFMDQNPAVWLMRGTYTNNPYIIAQNDNMISINSALQVDLVGQVCSESMGSIQYTGTGGALDFAIGATHSKGGKSIIAMRSTAKKGTISTIQPVLTPGAIVSIDRNNIDYIVTEYGIAKLKGVPLAGRVENLISIAHPDFRDMLREGVKQYKLW